MAALLMLTAALVSMASGSGLASASTAPGAAVAASAGAGAAPATTATTTPTGAAPAPPPPSTAPVLLPSPDIIPEPNSGRAPRDAGERGGSQQTLVFLLVCAGVLTVFGLAWRESRRKRAASARTSGEARSGRGPGPAGRPNALSRS